jgi:hypothetical protein
MPSLLLPGQNADLEAGDAGLHRRDEGRAIGGVADGGGRHHLQRVGPHGRGDGVVAGQHGQRRADRILVQPPRGLQPAAEAEHRLLVEDRLRVPAAAFKDHEPDGVGAEVDDAAAGEVGMRRWQ